MALLIGSPVTATEGIVSAVRSTEPDDTVEVRLLPSQGTLYDLDDLDARDFCFCCARPIHAGAIIQAGEVCCSVECALESSTGARRAG